MHGSLKHVAAAALCAAFAGYSVYVYTAGTRVPVKVAFDGRASAGQQLFQTHNCIACHQLYGLGGYMGPDLTNVVSAAGKGPVYARVFIENGTARMPDFGLTSREVEDLIAFLTYVDAAGPYPAENPQFAWYGGVEASP